MVRRPSGWNWLAGIHVLQAVIPLPSDLKCHVHSSVLRLWPSMRPLKNQSASLFLLQKSYLKPSPLNKYANLSGITSDLLWFAHSMSIITDSSCPPSFFMAEAIIMLLMSAWLFFFLLVLAPQQPSLPRSETSLKIYDGNLKSKFTLNTEH